MNCTGFENYNLKWRIHMSTLAFIIAVACTVTNKNKNR